MGKGKQRIEIKKIDKSSRLQVIFSKRRTGIFKKAAELSILCGADVAVIVASPGGKFFSFGHPSPEAVVERFLAGNHPVDSGEEVGHRVRSLSERYVSVVGEMEAEEERQKAVRGEIGGSSFWWDQGIGDLGLCELEKHAATLEVLKCKVIARADELAAATSALPVDLLDLSDGAMVDLFGGIDANCFDFGGK